MAKEAAAEAKERQEAALQAVREAEIQAASANLGEGEVLDLAKLDREKGRKKREKEEADFQALERGIMSDIGLNPDTFVVPVAEVEVFEADAAAEEEEKKRGAASGAAASKRASRLSAASSLSPDGIEVEVKE